MIASNVKSASSFDRKPIVMPDTTMDNISQSTVATNNTISGSLIQIVINSRDDSHNVAKFPNPYLGLQVFSYEHRAKFAGRDRLIIPALEILKHHGVLFVTGASGSGKSSLVQAGILPRIPPGTAWDIRTPQDQLATLGQQTDIVAQVAQLALPEEQKYILVLDQFEEVFIQADLDPARRLCDWLLEVEQQRPNGFQVIVTLRADYIGHAVIMNNQPLYRLIDLGIIVWEMNPDELTKAIRKPFQHFMQNPIIDTSDQNLKQDIIETLLTKDFETGLIERMIADTQGEAWSLPLLQLSLHNLWNKGLRLSAYQQLNTSIDQWATEVYQYVDYDKEQKIVRTASQQATIDQLLMNLLDFVETNKVEELAAFRKRVRLENLDADLAEIAQELSSSHLVAITPIRGQTTQQEVIIVHDRILSDWSHINKLVIAHTTDLLQAKRLQQRAEQWKASHDPNDLFSAQQLDDYVELLNNPFIPVAKVVVECKEATDREREKQRRQREERQRIAAKKRRQIIIVVSALTLASVAALVYILAPFISSELAALNTRTPTYRIETSTVDYIHDKRGKPVEISLAGFSLERYEVSQGQYRRCVDPGPCDRPANRIRYNNPQLDDQPMVDLTPLQAATYCAWLGRRLPTDSEFERAARGLSGRAFPWGNAPLDAKHARIAVPATDPATQLVPVTAMPEGATPANEGGIHHLVGNAAEIVIKDTPELRAAPDRSQQLAWDGNTPTTLSFAMIGGSFDSNLNFDLWSGKSRPTLTNGFSEQTMGFRCVEQP